jgi:hypothetical protein
MIAEYLEHALQFERMAAEAADPALKKIAHHPSPRVSQAG